VPVLPEEGLLWQKTYEDAVASLQDCLHKLTLPGPDLAHVLQQAAERQQLLQRAHAEAGRLESGIDPAAGEDGDIATAPPQVTAGGRDSMAIQLEPGAMRH
jgi:hypothetical protein